MNTPKPFKICPSCAHIWKTRSDLLQDPGVKLVGYQPNFGNLELGYFLFSHTCMTTLSIQAGAFRDLYDGPVFQERLTGTDACPGYCLHESELSPCNAPCECAYVRAILDIINHWPKQSPSP